jgi:hypothetical protein
VSSPAHSEPPSSASSEASSSQSPELVAVSNPAAALTDSQKLSVSQRLKVLRTRYSQLEAILFFAAGFTFDAVMLDRIDDELMLWQQIVYLGVAGLVLGMTFRHEMAGWHPPAWAAKPWKYSEHLLHFMLGTLLNAYTLFYFKAASGPVAVLFLVLIGCLLAINEMPLFHKMGPVVVMGIFSYALTSYFGYVIPVLVGSIRMWMFLTAEFLALLCMAPLFYFVERWRGRNEAILKVGMPGAAVQVFMLGLYIFHAIPPVPLALEAIGVYHKVEHTRGGPWRLSMTEPSGLFHRHGDTEFLARKGDKIHVFVRIFAPRHFRDRIFMRWFHQDPTRGWIQTDPIQLTIADREERGYPTFSTKANYSPGKWRVEVQTEDGRTVGEQTFTVVPDDTTTPRDFVVEDG